MFLRTPSVTCKGATAERIQCFLSPFSAFAWWGHPCASWSPHLSPSLSLSLLNTHTPGWMTSLFRPGFLYDRGISRILQQTSPDRWCSRALSRALSLSLTRSPQNDSLCTEHSSPIGSWRCEESDIYALGYLRKKKCTCFAGIVAISTVAAYTVL